MVMKQISAAKFKEQCLALLDQVNRDGIVITKRGKPVAKLIPLGTDSDAQVELRQIAEVEDFADAPAEVIEQERRLRAEGAKQAQILQAEGRREAAFRDAEARERSAEAEAKATEMVAQSIGAGGAQAINYFVANNYIKALQEIATSPNQKVLMLPVEAASLIGSLTGIAEIAKFLEAMACII